MEGRVPEDKALHFERNPYKVPSFVKGYVLPALHTCTRKILPILSMSPKAPSSQDKLLE
jgi:hypothetical protein